MLNSIIILPLIFNYVCSEFTDLYPSSFLISVQNLTNRICSGVILSEKKVITAAECVITDEGCGQLIKASDLIIVASYYIIEGDSSSTEFSQSIRQVHDITVMNNCDCATCCFNNIAYLTLEIPLQFTLIVNKVKFFGKGKIFDPKQSTFMLIWANNRSVFYGDMKQSEKNVFLQKNDEEKCKLETILKGDKISKCPIKLSITEEQKCYKLLHDITTKNFKTKFFCGKLDDNTGVPTNCIGEPGDPLLVNGELIGIRTIKRNKCPIPRDTFLFELLDQSTFKSASFQLFASFYFFLILQITRLLM